MKIKKILVTGGAGFIGSHLVDKLVQAGYQVFVIDDLSGGKKENVNHKAKLFICDLRDIDKADKTIKEIKPEIVFHLAANAAENKAQFSPIDITSRNWNTFINTLVPALKMGMKRIIVTSSIAVYGSLQTPFKETDKPEPEDLYGISKLAMEQALKVLSKVHKFEYVITRPHNCYDDQTEILTTNGFKLFKDLRKEDYLATLNPETNTLEYRQAYEWQKIPFKGKLYNFKSDSFDLSVTSDHKLWIQKQVGKKWEFETAESIVKRPTAYSSQLKRYADNWIGEDRPFHIIEEQKDVLGRSMRNHHQNGGRKIIPMDLWCQFLGWYISEGSRFKTKMNYVISLSQYKTVNPKNRMEIINLIKKMGINPYIAGDKEIRIFSKQLYKELDRLNIGKSKEKNIPKEIKYLDTKYLVHLFQTLMKGDGDKTGGRYTTNSKKLANDFSELCLKLRKSTTVTYDGTCYRISITNLGTPQLGDNHTKKLNVTELYYNGYTYDVTVPNHIIFVRRNGKACWSSNCYGSRQNMSDPYRNVVTIFMNSLMKGKPYYIYGDGNQRRCFSYIDDVVEALFNAGFGNFHGMTFNIGADKDHSINELSKVIQDVTDIKILPIHTDERPQEVKEAVADHTLAKRYLGYKDKTSLLEGIKSTWDYAKKLGPQEYKFDEVEIDSPLLPRNWKKK